MFEVKLPKLDLFYELFLKTSLWKGGRVMSHSQNELLFDMCTLFMKLSLQNFLLTNNFWLAEIVGLYFSYLQRCAVEPSMSIV